MGGDRARVPARDGPGERRVAGPEGVVEGRAEQRAEHPVGGFDARGPEQFHGLGDQRDQVVRAEGERRVVQRAGLLADPLGLAAHLDDERLRGEPQFLGAVTPKAQPASRCTSTGVPVNVMAGCSASGRAPARSAGSSTFVP